ncbi:MAG: NTP transferase domain-containing protein, partial [Candidatus Dormibacteraceae bacterium]
AGPHALAVAGGADAAELARAAGVEVLIESRPSGQNQAAAAGIQHALGRGAAAVLLLSSDLPLVTGRHVARMLSAGSALGAPAVLAAPATGRGGTNALYLAPPGAVGLHFGDGSLARYEADAAARGIPFALHVSPALALDLDEPDDLDRLRRMEPAG